MWNVKKENNQVVLFVNREKALSRHGEEFGAVKGITTGKKSGELVVSIYEVSPKISGVCGAITSCLFGRVQLHHI